MIYGDPFKFALQFDVVEAWNVQGSEWKNGVFALYVGGDRLFSLVDSVELRTTLSFYGNAPISQVGFGKAGCSAKLAFEDAYGYFIGDSNVLSDGVVNLTCTSMADAGVIVYLVKLSSGDRIVWSLDRGVTVSECLLDTGAVAKTISILPAMP